jgi:hypothetical protein
MPLKRASGLGATLQPQDVNQETLCEARSQKGRLQVQRLRRRSWTHPSAGLEEEGEDASSFRSTEEDR